MECQFSNPVDLGEGDFEYSTLTCPENPRFELIQNASTSAEFYIEKKVDYGDIFIFIIVSILIAIVIGDLIWDFFWKKWILNF